jgi:energy-coupling factor transport system substrate-specific component
MKQTLTSTVVLAASCIALNVAIGSIVYLLKLPVYLDSIGIMLAALLAPGTRWNAAVTSAIVAIISYTVIGLLVSPFEPWFIGTGVAGAIYGAYIARGRVSDLIAGTAGPLKFVGKTLLYGIGWGVVAAAVSAPVVVYLFGGVTGAGSTLILTYLVKTGHQLLNAALLTGFAADPVDKTISMLCAILIARATPPSFKAHLAVAVQ